ncbi:hypothetical protein San01_72400 [Streptomyces angustmyceticus]|uniref:Uncharacterized protein n=2 Tax=Streptomyces angustmyceticus TaxID=285578 RepID=A0A5J4LRT6_9ACTN|nr:hypothetical protein San01_72400 [Streptomyces angustmyceticus]
MLPNAATTTTPPMVFYQVVATVIPLLMLNYFFQVKADEHLNSVTKTWGKKRKWTAALISLVLGPLAAAVGAVLGETSCLLALHQGKPGYTTASVTGLIMLTAAGGIHWCTGFLKRTGEIKKYLAPESSQPRS